ncbi:S41 family peptidase [Halomonas cerina]|uniref:Carboxyl-terminal processing protease n=1 Tax=Halomonas cerina TaxID=447424 RepID=A0A839VI93_9GAMM|nr:S41 family peptidase [Halomonas cerina]MBB3192397.1 carboxyl-terminal processing protease [Halomonas cerina]
MATDVEQIIGILEARALMPPPPDARERLAVGPIEETLRRIDPYARLFAADAYQTPGLEALPSGIGAELKSTGAHLELWPYQDGPADRAGIIGGSRLREVDGVEVVGTPPAEVAERLRGTRGSAVDLTLSDPVGKERRVRLFRSDFQPLDVESHVEHDRQLLRIRRFRAGLTRPAVAARLAAYRAQRAEWPLVLDLRFSGGGDVFEALDVAGLFLESGRELVAFADRSGGRERFTNRRSGDTVTPLSIWIGPDTASAAEILAAILRYHGRAELRGSPSLGKCSIQTDVPLPDGAVLRFTEKRVLLPDGSTCDGHPLEPDRPLPSAPAFEGEGASVPPDRRRHVADDVAAGRQNSIRRPDYA